MDDTLAETMNLLEMSLEADEVDSDTATMEVEKEDKNLERENVQDGERITDPLEDVLAQTNLLLGERNETGTEKTVSAVVENREVAMEKKEGGLAGEVDREAGRDVSEVGVQAGINNTGGEKRQSFFSELVEDGIVKEELEKVRACIVKEVHIVSCGQKVNASDVFLLDSALRMEIRPDLSNQTVMAMCSQVLGDNDYDVQVHGEAHLQASFELIDKAQIEIEQHLDAERKPKSEVSSHNEDADAANVSIPAPFSALSSWAKSRMDMQSAKVSRVFASSVGKLNNALSSVDPSLSLPKSIIDRASSSEDKDRAQQSVEDENSLKKVAILVLGVDVRSKVRILMLSGLENNTNEVLAQIISRGVPNRPLSSPIHVNGETEYVLHEDFTRDLVEAYRIWSETKLLERISEQEMSTRKLEWGAAQLVSLAKASYKQYGVRVPGLERAPFVSQLPLDYGEAGKPNFDEIDRNSATWALQSFGSHQSMIHALDLFMQDLDAKWAVEIDARYRRKLQQLAIRSAICERNRALIIERLDGSEVARSSKETLDVAHEMKVPPSVVLGSIPAIFEKKPGRLMITMHHLLFSSNILGFRTSLAVPLKEVQSVSYEATTGASSFLGDASVIVSLTGNTSGLSFLVSSLLESERLTEMVAEIQSTHKRMTRRNSATTSSTISKSVNSTNEVGGNEDHAEALPPTSKIAIDDEGVDVESDRAAIQEAEEKRRVMDMQKMMASTLLQEDEEEF